MELLTTLQKSMIVDFACVGVFIVLGWCIWNLDTRVKKLEKGK